MKKSMKFGALSAAGLLALAACGGGGGSASGSTSGAPAGKNLVVSIDVPLQGAMADLSKSMVNAATLVLEQAGNKAGDYNIEFKTYDDSTAAKGGWDDAQCAKNAQDHVANPNEVAVIGTFNSGCAKIELPILNQAPDGPLFMISMANTNPGLTKAWDPGEPDIYYPTGKRNYARVVTTDDYEGPAGAQFLQQEKGVKKCAVLNDNQTYGQGVAKAFAAEAKKVGIEVVLEESWDAKQTNYTALFEKVKGLGADCVYFGGIFDNNGGQLLKDKVATLGDNTKVFLMGPAGWTGYPPLQAMPEAEGMFMSFSGLSTTSIEANGGAAAKFLADYKAKFGSAPAGSFAIYSAAAMQIVLKAIAASDGTRAGVNTAAMNGAGLTLPASESVTGGEIAIDPATGDVKSHVVTIQTMKGGVETDVMPWEVK